jgi:hypothetical protein
MSKKDKGGQKVIWPGFSYRPPPRHVAKIGRNDPCPCESGKKYKDCHEKEGSAFLKKLAEKERRRQWRQIRSKQGVPWYKRLFSRRASKKS